MKKLLAVVFLFTIVLTLNAQSLKIGIGGGPAFIQSSGIPSSEDIDNNIDFKNGYQIGGRVKIGFLVPFNLIGQVNYYKLKGSGTTTIDALMSPVQGDYNTTLLTIVVGGQYELIPGPIAPHLDLDLMMTSFGETEISTQISNWRELKVEGKDRIGLGIGAGVDISVLEVGIKYNMHNFFGKEDGEEALNTVTLTAALYFDLL